MQLVGHAPVVQILELREEGRDADAAGDQHVLARDLVEREQSSPDARFRGGCRLPTWSCMKCEPPRDSSMRRTPIS